MLNKFFGSPVVSFDSRALSRYFENDGGVFFYPKMAQIQPSQNRPNIQNLGELEKSAVAQTKHGHQHGETKMPPVRVFQKLHFRFPDFLLILVHF